MNEEIQESQVQESQVQEEVEAQEVEEPEVQEQVEQTVEESQEEKQNFEHNSFQENLRKMRESKEQAEYERDQLAQYVENIKRQFASPKQNDDEFGIKEDEYVEGKDFNRVSKNVKKLQQEVQQWRAYSEEATAELKLNNEFNDFNQVVTSKNVKALIKKHPELRSSVQNNDPLYSRGKATYKLIKKFMSDEIDQPVNKTNQRKVQNNIGKPRSSVSVKDTKNSPLSEAGLLANGYNEEVGQALENEMYDIISRY